jgi:hypothetical protein
VVSATLLFRYRAPFSNHVAKVYFFLSRAFFSGAFIVPYERLALGQKVVSVSRPDPFFFVHGAAVNMA